MARRLRVLPAPVIEEPDEVLTLGDLFEDLRYQVSLGEREAVCLRLSCLAEEYADTPLPGR
ncbi:hypothetical protein GCM10012275_54670 [Longimycelium tulufanense]|uniref:Uncharacterized protein n=1 Tax=Longimycelium tulufanense TaxID=907463 RepID=A0A8J3CJC3_9PSEU|nr:hypothetical protein [Longimycelium tulufanense]GGM77099.1 hypothetical protein GCM10012275_54670 [Longimycelium tulufanense]